ncbi:MAG: enoyl-CoA hydratase/isomerase family protein [Chloroflexi bacterium]|nr:enoyl-CoA hydratase/isomerase family protein [Chloroflexota bacterium]
MDFQNIILDKRDRIATITLNRPERLNALSGALMGELDVALADLENDRAIKVVIIKGAGRAFSVGYDVNPTSPERYGGMVDIGHDRRRLNNTVKRWLRLWDLSKPTIAQCHGYCVAGGTQLVSMCDLTIVSEDCQIGLPTAGPLGAGLMAAEWCHLVGVKKTKEMFYVIGKLIDGKEAARIGWANKAVPADQLDAEVNKLASEIADMPLEFLEIQKAAINHYVEMSGLREAMFYGADLDAVAHFTKPVQQFISLIRERGIKQAKADWKKVIS